MSLPVFYIYFIPFYLRLFLLLRSSGSSYSCRFNFFRGASGTGQNGINIGTLSEAEHPASFVSWHHREDALP